MDLLQKFVESIILERSFDINVRETALKLMDEIRDGLNDHPDKQVRRTVINVNGSNDCTCLFVFIHDLGILTDRITKNLAVGIIPAQEYPSSDTSAVFLTPNSRLPVGGIFFIDENASLSAKRILMMLNDNKYDFMHELIHFIELSIKSSEKRLQSVNTSLEKINSEKEPSKKYAAYLLQPHELNAYLHDTFHELTDKFAARYPKQTKRNAARFAPTAQKLWNIFYKSLPSIKRMAGEDKLMRKLAARLWEMWEDYVDRLPD